MSFFVDLPDVEEPEPEPEIDEYDGSWFFAPEWISPPRGVVGATVEAPTVLAKNSACGLWIDRVAVFPNALQIDLVFELADPLPDGRVVSTPFPWGIYDDDPHERRSARRQWRPERASDLFRFGIGYADGQRTEMLPVDWEKQDFQTQPTGLTITATRGSDGQHRFEETLWVWPAPPPGPVTIHVAWHGMGITETSHRIEGSALASAADRIERIW